MHKKMWSFVQDNALKILPKRHKPQNILVSDKDVIKYILQFHQGMKQGKGIRVNPLNLVPAQVTERKRD